MLELLVARSSSGVDMVPDFCTRPPVSPLPPGLVAQYGALFAYIREVSQSGLPLLQKQAVLGAQWPLQTNPVAVAVVLLGVLESAATQWHKINLNIELKKRGIEPNSVSVNLATWTDPDSKAFGRRLRDAQMKFTAPLQPQP
jgi:hypothetical protein